jgi:hypothetical protein
MIVEPVISSGVITTTATTVVCSGHCLVSSVLLNPGTAATTLLLLDPAEQTGTRTSTGATTVTQLVAPANGNVVPHDLTRPLEFKNGCVVVLTGAASTAAVYFSKIGGA